MSKIRRKFSPEDRYSIVQESLREGQGGPATLKRAASTTSHLPCWENGETSKWTKAKTAWRTVTFALTRDTVAATSGSGRRNWALEKNCCSASPGVGTRPPERWRTNC